MDIVKAIKNALGFAGHEIKVFVIGAGHKILTIVGDGDEAKGKAELTAMGMLALHELESALGKIVMKHVLIMATSDKTGAEKYKSAYAGITTEANAAGLVWSEYWLDTLIQFAVGVAKGYYGAK